MLRELVPRPLGRNRRGTASLTASRMQVTELLRGVGDAARAENEEVLRKHLFRNSRKSEGKSFLRVRSPDAPKMMSPAGWGTSTSQSATRWYSCTGPVPSLVVAVLSS